MARGSAPANPKTHSAIETMGRPTSSQSDVQNRLVYLPPISNSRRLRLART